jgi:hypothetical protein
METDKGMKTDKGKETHKGMETDNGRETDQKRDKERKENRQEWDEIKKVCQVSIDRSLTFRGARLQDMPPSPPPPPWRTLFRRVLRKEEDGFSQID